MIATVLNISEDLWTEVPATIVDINKLQAKDFAKWVRKQVRQYGRKSEICTQSDSAVEIWLKELGIGHEFICGGEIKVDGQWIFSDFQASGYYMFDEDGRMETFAGKWLEIANLEDPEAYLIGR